MKSPRYVQLHLMKDSMTPKRMLEIIRSDESDEFLTYFPEMKPLHSDILCQYNNLIKETRNAFFSIVDALQERGEDRKNKRLYAEYALKYPFSGALFAGNNNLVSPEKYYQELHIDSLMRLVGLKDFVDETASPTKEKL